MPASSQASQRFLKSAPVVYGVVKRCVEDHHIELCGHERKAIHFGPEAQEWRYKVEIMPGCAEAVCVIHQQVDSHRTMPTLCQPIRQPSVARPNVQNIETPRIGTFDVR